MDQIWIWVIFNIAVVILLAFDLFFFHRKAHVIEVKEALWMSAFWIAISFAFNIFIYYFYGKEDALNFLTGYLIEKALSIDNLFIFLMIFSYFRVPADLLHKVLFWGILGTIIMRAILIVFGIALVQKFHWVIYLFGLFLIITGIKLAKGNDKEVSPESNPLIKLLQRFMPITHDYVGSQFFIKQAGKYVATPLFLVLLAVESTDLIFALDSIPAIIGITTEPFIVYTSNILAVLGLRSLFFALSHMITLFHYLQYGLAFILIFIGVKMLISGYIAIPIVASLSFVLLALIVSIIASILNPKKV